MLNEILLVLKCGRDIMDEYLKCKESTYHAYFAMKEYCDEYYLPFLNKPGSLNLLYELNGVLNSPIFTYTVKPKHDIVDDWRSPVGIAHRAVTRSANVQYHSSHFLPAVTSPATGRRCVASAAGTPNASQCPGQ